MTNLLLESDRLVFGTHSQPHASGDVAVMGGAKVLSERAWKMKLTGRKNDTEKIEKIVGRRSERSCRREGNQTVAPDDS